MSKAALRKAAQRARKFLPKDPNKYAYTINYLMETGTPKQKEAIRRQRTTVGIPGTKKNLLTEKLLEGLKENLKKHKRKKGVILASLKVMKKYRLAKATTLMFGISPSTLCRYKEEETRCVRKDALSSENKETIRDFYNRPDVSTSIPDRRSVKKGCERKCLTRPIAAVFSQYREENPNVKVAFSTFASLRPDNINTTQNHPWYSCLCDICTNTDLKLRALRLVCFKLKKPHLTISDKYAAINLTLCGKSDTRKFHQKKCINRQCNKCSENGILDHFSELTEGFGDESIEFTKWERQPGINKHGKATTRVMMLKSKTSIKLLVEQLVQEISTLALHLFNARWQQVQFSTLTKKVPMNWVILNLDFAENYACVSQMEVQSAHWAINQVTIHPIVAYYNCTEPGCDHGTTVQESLLMISNDLTHDYHAVHAFIKVANNHLQHNRNLIISREIQFSDGCACQYKSHGPFCDISYAIRDFGFPVERHFYGSRHGKGPSDGAGAVLKSAARQAVKGQRYVINTAKDMYEFAQHNLKKDDDEKTHTHSRRTIFFVPTEEIDRNRPNRAAKTVKGTRSLHAIRAEKPMKISSRNLSCFCPSCTSTSSKHGCESQEHCGPWIPTTLKNRGISAEPTEERESVTAISNSDVSPPRQLFGLDVDDPMMLDGTDQYTIQNLLVYPDEQGDANIPQSLTGPNDPTLSAVDFIDDAVEEELLRYPDERGDVSPPRPLFGLDVDDRMMLDGTDQYTVENLLVYPDEQGDVPKCSQGVPEQQDAHTSLNNELSQRYSVGNHVLLKHGLTSLPAVISEVQDGVPYVHYFKEKPGSKGRSWILQESTKYSLLDQDVDSCLDPPELRVTELQKFRWRNQQLKKQYIGSLILYSIIFYILAALVFFLYYLPDTWKDRALYSTPLLIFPVMVWLLKKFLHWYFIKRIAKNDIELEEIRSKKKQILEEVMEKETYKKAKDILEKYDPERFKKVEKPVVTPKPVTSPASTGLRQRSVGLRVPTPQVGRGRGLSPGGTPRLPQGRGSPIHPRQIMSVGRNGSPMMSPYNRPPGPPLPRPVLPRERGKMDKLVEYFVGDGPQNRYALICRFCHSHNGMALKEEFEFLTFRCCYCYQLNPARKQKPYAPKIDFTTPPSGTPLPKAPSRPLQQSTPNAGGTPGPPLGSKEGVQGQSDESDEDEGSEEGSLDEDGEEGEGETNDVTHGEHQTDSHSTHEEQLPPPVEMKQEVDDSASESTNGVLAALSGLSLKTEPTSAAEIHENGPDTETEQPSSPPTNTQSNGSSLSVDTKIT